METEYTIHRPSYDKQVLSLSIMLVAFLIYTVSTRHAEQIRSHGECVLCIDIFKRRLSFGEKHAINYTCTDQEHRLLVYFSTTRRKKTESTL